MIKWGYIYKIINPVGQVYVGQTFLLEHRKAQYKGLFIKRQRLIYKSIKHYGWANHSFDIVYRFNASLLNINTVEVFFIKFFNSYYYNNKQYGLNLTEGGASNYKLIHTEESKKKISNSSKQRGCAHLHTSEVRRGIGIKKRVPVYQFDRDCNFIKKWDGVISAARYYNISPANITAFIRKKKGLYIQDSIWSYTKNIEWYKEYRTEREQDKSEFYQGTRKKVVQLTMTGEFIKEWGSIKYAAEAIGSRSSNLHQCFSGRSSHCKGYKWMYASEYYKQHEITT